MKDLQDKVNGMVVEKEEEVSNYVRSVLFTELHDKKKSNWWITNVLFSVIPKILFVLVKPSIYSIILNLFKS